MAAEDSVDNGIPVESSSSGARLMDDGVNCFPNENGAPVPASGDGDPEGLGSRKVRTYKRRKCGEVSLEPKITQLEKCFSHQLQDEMSKQVGCTDIGLQKSSCEQVCHPRKSWKSHKISTDYSHHHWRSSLQNMFQSFSGDHVGISGIKCCIRDVLSESPQVDTAKFAQGENDTPEDQCIAQHDFVPKRSLIDVGKHADLASTGSVTELHAPTVTKQCQHALFRMIMSERFVSLCKLLSENFQACKFDKILDFSMLNSRMKEGSYEQAPSLFLSDVQQLWKKLHVIGIEMVSLSKSLSEMPKLVYGESERCDDSLFEVCRKCGENSVGRDHLVCDSCEEMFHLSCIKPAVTEISRINWCCANCTALGTELHESCVVCERFDAPRRTTEVGVSTNDEAPVENEESSDIIEKGIRVFKSCKRVCCKVCKSILENGELFRLCEHHACSHYYHVRCLTNKQLKSYSSRWYCPCCLCRVCLVDKDDDKIVMCDACDHAYHIYCMHPPQESIPGGQWYCRKCDSGLQAIHKAKLAYKSSETKKEGKKVKKRKLPHEKRVDTAGGVDMLLNAASAISHQEQLSAICNKDWTLE